MRQMNKVILVGNLGSTPELRVSNKAGRSVTNFNLCTNEFRRNADGEKVHHPEWHKVVAWGNLAELCVENLGKGSKVYLKGRLQTRQREVDGKTFPVTEIVASRIDFLRTKEDVEDVDVEREVAHEFDE